MALKQLTYTQKNVEKVIRKRRNNKQFLIQYKGGKCQKCGYDKPIPNAYHFHHLDPSTKEFTIGHRLTRKLETLKREVDKCILLCANCHAEQHQEEFDNSTNTTIEKIKSYSQNDLIKMSTIKRPKPRTKICLQCKQDFVPEKFDQTFCSVPCFRLSRRKVARPSKEQLLQELENSNYCELGRKYNVSDNCIRKWIK